MPLIARFPAGGLSGATGIEGNVTAQACDAKTCPPPATLTLIIKPQG